MRTTAKERRALRMFRDCKRGDYPFHVHANTRHALERKGLLRGSRHGWVPTAAGRAVLSPPSIPDIFDDLFPPKKAP